MAELSTIGKIQELIDKLNYYTKLYDEGKPDITDSEWDKMYFELQEMERATGIYLPDSPTQKVNYQVVNELKKVKHNHPMLSLDKTKSIEEMNAFIGNKDFITMLKMDGLTCSLGYKNGVLVSAETRGNGIEGEDILHNIMVVKNVPHRIGCKEDMTIDGEIICTYDNFEEFKNEYANPRNFASGSIRLLDSAESAKRNLSFIAWDIIGLSNKYPNLHSKLMYLTELGFDRTAFQIDREFNQELIDEMSKWAKAWGYPIDGLVVKYNNCAEYDACGRTDHHFKGGMAFKFYDEEYETKLLGIEWSMGRTGQITPIALFEKVIIDGTEVSRASLSNISIMKQTLGKPFLGQTIYVSKRNEIIPKIEKAKGVDGKWI